MSNFHTVLFQCRYWQRASTGFNLVRTWRTQLKHSDSCWARDLDVTDDTSVTSTFPVSWTLAGDYTQMKREDFQCLGHVLGPSLRFKLLVTETLTIDYSRQRHFVVPWFRTLHYEGWTQLFKRLGLLTSDFTLCLLPELKKSSLDKYLFRNFEPTLGWIWPKPFLTLLQLMVGTLGSLKLSLMSLDLTFWGLNLDLARQD